MSTERLTKKFAMMSFWHWASVLRQFLVPSEFRVSLPRLDSAASPLVFFLDDLTAALQTSAEAGLPKDLALDLSNQAFRLKRNLKALEEAGIQNKETRMLNRTLGAIDQVMRKYESEAIDFTGKIIVEWQRDFEIAGQAERRTDVKQPTCVFCERPAVLFKGVLIQTGRGIVAVPETRQEDAS